MIKLNSICTKGSSSIAQKDLEGKDGSYPIYGASGFIKNVDFYQQEKPYIAIVKDGAGVGRVMKLPAYSSVIGTMQYIIPNDEVDVSYLAYALEHMNLGKYYTGATIPHIYFKDYCNELLPAHTQEEQIKIAASLDKVSQLIALRKEQLARLNQLTKSRFIELFGNPLDGTAKYSLHQVGEVAEAVDPQPSHRTPPIEEGGIPYVSIKDCNHKTGKIDFDGARKVSRTVLAEHLSRYTLQDGDFVIGKIGTIGNPVFVPARSDYTLSANVVLVQPNSELVSPWFLKYSFESEFVEQQFAEAKNSTSQAAFGIQKVRSIEIMNPDLDTQRRFESFVKQTDKSKLAIQQSLDKLELLKKSLMQEYFG